MGSARINAVRQRLALNEEPFIVDKTSNRPSFLTPNGNYIGRNIRTKEQLYSDSNTHSGLIEGFGDKNPNEIYDYGDYTDNPIILDFMNRETFSSKSIISRLLEKSEVFGTLKDESFQ